MRKTLLCALSPLFSALQRWRCLSQRPLIPRRSCICPKCMLSLNYATTCSLDCAIEQLTSASEVEIADREALCWSRPMSFLCGRVLSSDDNEKVLSQSFFAREVQDECHWLSTRVPAPSRRGLLKPAFLLLSSASAVPLHRINDMGKRYDS